MDLIIGIFVALLILGGLTAAGFYVFWLFIYMLKARPENRFDRIPERIGNFFTYVIGQARVIREPAGLFHFFIFWGFLVLQVETLEYIVRAFAPSFHWSGLIGVSAANGLMFIQDVFGFLVFAAVGAAFVRRFVIKPKHAVVSFEAASILLLIGALMVSKFLANGADIAMAVSADDLGWDRRYTPVASLVSWALFGGAYSGQRAVFWTEFIYHAAHLGHIAIVIFFANYIPRSKHMHVLTAVPNVFFRKLEPAGSLYPLNLEDENAESFGAGKLQDLTWKQVLDTYACTECGRCEHYCPAYNTGKALNPMMVVLKLQDHAREVAEDGKMAFIDKALMRSNGHAAHGDTMIAGGIISAEELWACTTCGACVANCPVFIEHVDIIVDMRRYLTLTDSAFPPEVGRVFRNIENNGNPWGIARSKRAEWTEGLGFDIPHYSEMTVKPDYLFWVGCAGSFDDRQKKVTVAMAKILKAAGVSFGILGKDESCTGDPARRIGNEYLYQSCAQQNIETLNNAGVTKVVTACPHCFHTVGKEYPQLGGNFEVVHHTHLLKQLLADGRIPLKANGGATRITYHDSCYVGRWCDEYDSPRDVLKAIGDIELVEMDQNRRKAMCCGAGGGRMWMEEPHGKRVNLERSDQAIATGAEVVAVACPFCMTMMTDGVAQRGAEQVKTRDVAEILVDSVDAP